MRTRAVFLAGLAALGAKAALAAPSGFVATEDFARPPQFFDMRISPDGRTLAYLHDFEGRPALMMADAESLKSLRLDPGTIPGLGASRQVMSYQWIGDRRVIYTTSFWDTFISGVSAVDCDGHNYRPVSGTDASAQYPLYALETIHHFDDAGHSILMLDRNDPLGRENILYPNVVKVNTLEGGYRTVVKNPGDVVGWETDREGVVRVGITREGKKQGLIYREGEGAPWRVVPKPDETRGEITPFGFDRSGQRLYVAALSTRRRWALYPLDPVTGILGNAVLEDPDYDLIPTDLIRSADGVPLTMPIFSRKKRDLVGVYYVTDGPRVRWLDPDYAEFQRRIDWALPGTMNIITSATRDERRFLILAYSDINPGAYYIFDAGKRTVTGLVQRMGWIDPRLMASMYPIKYAARDGQTIHGYMTLPRNRSRAALPLIVMPHGGPWARDMWEFDPLVQLLANRGYAVLQMNYRGSPGYGDDFSRLGRHEVGRKMQDDIEDGTRWAIAHGISDPRRIAIVGASYGGYSALFALGHSPGLYCCGISIAGVTDWSGIIKGKTGGEYKFAYQYWVEHFADPKTDLELLRSISPVNFADQITAPLLMIQGKEDKTVPPRQARLMISALEKTGHPPESLFIAGEGHGFRGDRARIKEFKRIEEFLARYLHPE